MTCPECNSSFKARWGLIRKGSMKCPSCNRVVSKADLPEFGGGARASVTAPTPTQTQTVVREPETTFKQIGILCLACMNVTPLGNKKCQKCRKKLKVKPSVMVYFNGISETVQCQKCRGYTDFRQIKCQECNKKLKL